MLVNRFDHCFGSQSETSNIAEDNYMKLESIIATVVVTVVVAISMSASAATSHDFNTDPGWSGSGNMTGSNNYGWTGTEVGGDFKRDGTHHHFSGSLGGVFGPTDVFSASGTFRADHSDTSGDAGASIFFHDGTGDNYIGIAVYSHGSTTVRTFLTSEEVTAPSTNSIGFLNGGQASSGMAVNTDFDWEFTYNGDGTATIVITQGVSPVGSVTGAVNFPAAGISHFGVGEVGGQSDRPTTPILSLFIDDVTYDVVPEPASLLLMGMGSLLVMRRRR